MRPRNRRHAGRTYRENPRALFHGADFPPGRCPRGERLVSHVPQGDWTTITFIAGLRHNRMTAPMVIEGAMNGPAFLAYIE